MSDLSGEFEDAVQRMLDGEESAFRTVYRTVHPPLLRYLSVLVGPDAAEDVASETWGQAFRDLAKFHGDADGFRGWVTTIGRHRALDFLRKKSRQPVADVELGQALEMPGSADVEATVLALVSTEAAMRLIRSLPRDQAEAVMLRAVLGLDAKTAAGILGKRPGAVRSAAHRGLSSLARQLANKSELPGQQRDTLPPAGAEEVT